MRSFLGAALGISTFLSALGGTALADQPVVFNVKLDPAARNEPATGRLIVLIVKADAKLPGRAEPIDGPFWENPQPLFGKNVKDLAAGASVALDDSADCFPVKPSQLEPGKYTAQARLDVSRVSSEWRRQPGNMYSKAVAFEVEKDKPAAVELTLSQATDGPRKVEDPRVEIVEIFSPLLTKFYGVPTSVRAAVVKPKEVEARREYAAIYHVPGFGGGLEAAYGLARNTENPAPNSVTEILSKNVYQIVLDPESSNGHTLFADSENNGPRGEALVTELIPAVQTRFMLKNDPAARLLRGHSSGGWSTLWLAVNYPETFGATWSSSPDPIDFRKFQLINIYQDQNAYTGSAEGKDLCSYRKGGKELMTIRQENGGEQVIGPDNTSAQQWDSWFAVFGPKNSAGHPAALFDPMTGAIDHAVAEKYRKFDIAERLRADPEKVGAIFRKSIRLYVGDQDNFYLNEAVGLFKQEIDKLYPEDKVAQAERFGRISTIAGVDHGTIFGTTELRAISQDMVEHLLRANLVK